MDNTVKMKLTSMDVSEEERVELKRCLRTGFGACWRSSNAPVIKSANRECCWQGKLVGQGFPAEVPNEKQELFRLLVVTDHIVQCSHTFPNTHFLERGMYRKVSQKFHHRLHSAQSVSGLRHQPPTPRHICR